MSRIEGLRYGRLDEDEKATIERLCSEWHNPTPGMVARRLNRHRATITWYMLANGLLERQPGHAPRVFERNGRTVHPYCPRQDARLTELLVANPGRGRYQLIAEVLTKEFGVPRNQHSVRVRAVQLAAAPEADL